MTNPAQAPASERVLLDAEALDRTLHRIAHEIIEGNPDLEQVALVGIHTRGVAVAQRLRALIEQFADTEVALGHARHHVLPRRRPRARPRGAAPPAAGRARDSARLPARGEDLHPRRRRPLHRPHDPRRRSRRCSTTAGPPPSGSPSSATEATASSRSVPTTSARTCPPHAASACRCSSSRWTRSTRSCSSPLPRRNRTDDRDHRRARRPAAEAGRAPAPHLHRRPHARRRRAAARDGAQLRERGRPRGEEAADAARPHGRQRLLRVVDAHVVELRARRQAALGRRDVDQGLGLGGGQGRVAEGHGAHARRLRPGRHRHPPPAHRRPAARGARDGRARRQRRRRQAPAPDAGAARPLHDPAGAGAHRGAARGDRRRRAPLARGAVEHPGARPVRRLGDARRAADAHAARHRGDGLQRSPPTSTRSRRRTSSTCSACSKSGCSRARTTCRASASTRRAGA